MAPDPRGHLPLTPVVHQILLSLADAPRHGYGVLKHVYERTEGEVELEAGTLYAAIKRLRDDGLVEDRRAPPNTDGRRRYYGLTPLGRRVLRAESERLMDLIERAREAGILAPSRRHAR